jgi:anaerobic selenocysteine-containing dehydrogenase
VERIHSRGTGRLVRNGGSATPLSAISSADDLWGELDGGAGWEGDRATPFAGAPASLTAGDPAALRGLIDRTPDEPGPLTLLVRGTRDVTASAAASPVMSKLYAESGLRRDHSTVAMHPRTAKELHLARGRRVAIETAEGTASAVLQTDARVMPGVIEGRVGPALSAAPADGTAVLDLLPGGESWRAVTARVVEA